jgi:hypothetical protein
VTFLDTGPFAPVEKDGHRESIQWEFTTMRASIKYMLLFGVTALLVARPVHAQDRTAEIDGIFSWATPATPG